MISTEIALSPVTRFPEFNDAWKIKLLGALSKTVTSGSRDWAQYYAPSGDKFIRMTNLSRGGINLLLDDLRFVKLPTNSSEGKRTSLVTHDILISITAELGKIGLIPPAFGTAYINQHTALVRLDLEKADARFVAQKLASKKMNKKINRLNDAGAKSGLNLPTIRTIPIDLPSLPEQQKIADFLTAVDTRIGQLSQKKALLEAYKKGVMQQLFSQAIRFKHDDGSEYPDWEETKLGALSDVRDGTHESPKYHTTGHPMVTSKNLLKDGSLDLKNVDLITAYDFHSINKRSKVDVGDILFGMIGTIGNPVLLKVDGFAIKNVALIKEKSDLTNRYLVQYLHSIEIKRQFHIENTGGTQKFIALGVIRNLLIKVPSLSEQTKIANFLSAIDSKIENVSKQIEETKTFKKGLLQQMFV